MRVIGELLIFALLLLTNSRVLFVKHERRDSLVIVSPVSVVFSILHICAWGADLLNLYCLALSVLVLLTNFHALFRYSESLYVDHYSFLMYFWSVITSLLSLAGIVLCVLFFPKIYFNNKINLTETKLVFEGSARSEFVEKPVFGKANAIMTIWQPIPEDPVVEELVPEARTILVFVADKRSDTEYSKPYLQLLSTRGYTVSSTDFYTDDIKWLSKKVENKMIRRFALLYSAAKKEKFKENQTKYTYNTTMELEALLPMLQQNFGEEAKYILISDVMTDKACELFAKKNSEVILSNISISEMEDYLTPGYGFVSQAFPLAVLILNKPRDFKGTYVNKVVDETVALVEKALFVSTSTVENPETEIKEGEE